MTEVQHIDAIVAAQSRAGIKKYRDVFKTKI